MTRKTIQVIHSEHAALAAMLQSLRMMVSRMSDVGTRENFEVMRAMLFYVDEFPERLHHPKETELLFPRVLARVPTLSATIDRLNLEHSRGEEAVRSLQNRLLAWEWMGKSRRAIFSEELGHYVEFCLAHMRCEEREILPSAELALSDADWRELDAAFERNQDPLDGRHQPAKEYETLFRSILMSAPDPIGLGRG
jgi:hemerythrin-like domain-containing protein